VLDEGGVPDLVLNHQNAQLFFDKPESGSLLVPKGPGPGRS
jgi:hypothetical protein